MHIALIFSLLVAIISLRPASAGEQWRTANYPGKPVRISVPFAPGGGLDTATRLVATHAEKELGQRIDVVNPTGGGNIRGNMTAINAEPDGYTIGAWGNGLVT
ncbi:MAG: hypothetical protein LIP23_03930, partial [Planctomycetes bacterium]|nr:hypothetical protein [Planctomycetota bacterium]